MKHNKHVFRQDVDCLRYAALGDSSVRVIALHYAIKRYNLDAIVVPPSRRELLPLWRAVFGKRVCAPNEIPSEYRTARVSAPTSLDWQYGHNGWDAFEGVLWENGFFDTRTLMIDPPLVFPCNFDSRAVMIYPEETTDGNRVFNAEWWISTCQLLRNKGRAIHCLTGFGSRELQPFYEAISFDRIFPPTIDGLRECIASSSLAIGGSTGPTWTCLMSDIPQIVLESKKSPHGCWHFDRCQLVLSKRLSVLPTLESIFDQNTKNSV